MGSAGTAAVPTTGRQPQAREDRSMADEFTLTFTGDQEVPPNGTAASGAGTVS